MRTAITIGITKTGTAEIISHPKVAYHKQRAEFNALTRGRNDKYVEIQFFPSKGRMLRRRFKQDQKGGVNYNAAHRVDDQAAAKKKGGKKLSDLTPSTGAKGGVNMDAGKRIDDQAKPPKKKSARVRKPAAKSTAKKSASSAKSAVKKSHTAGAKAAGAPAESAGGKSEEKSSSDSGPTL